MSKIKIPINDELSLVAMQSKDPNFPCEIYVGVADSKDEWRQNIAYVRREYEYGEEEVEFANAFCVESFSRPELEEPDRYVNNISLVSTKTLSLEDFLKSGEWKKSPWGGYVPDVINLDFCMNVIRVRFPAVAGGLAGNMLEKTMNYIFADPFECYSGSLAYELLPNKIWKDNIVSYCLNHIGEKIKE